MPRCPDHNFRRRFGIRPLAPGILIGFLALAAVCLSTVVGVSAQTARPAGTQEMTISLYFADPTRFALQAEQRQILRPETPTALGKLIVRELTTGPQSQGLGRTLPAGEVLRTFFIDGDRTAYIDFNNTMWQKHPGGLQADMLALYSIVNSLVLNMAEIEAVQFLNLGREPLPTAGHLDLRYPLKANILLIR